MKQAEPICVQTILYYLLSNRKQGDEFLAAILISRVFR